MYIFLAFFCCIILIIIYMHNIQISDTNTETDNTCTQENKPVQKPIICHYICERCGHVERFKQNMDVECRFCGYKHMIQTKYTYTDFLKECHEYQIKKHYRFTQSFYDNFYREYKSKIRKEYFYIPTNRVYDKFLYKDICFRERMNGMLDEKLLPVIRCKHCGKKILYKNYNDPTKPEPTCRFCGSPVSITKPYYDYTLRCANCMESNIWEYDVTYGRITCSNCGYIAVKSPDILDE